MEGRENEAAKAREEEHRILERIGQTRPGTPERAAACEEWRQFARTARLHPPAFDRRPASKH